MFYFSMKLVSVYSQQYQNKQNIKHSQTKKHTFTNKLYCVIFHIYDRQIKLNL